MKTNYSLLTLLFFVSAITFAQETIFTSGQLWKYYDAGDEPSGDWKTASYNDSLWTSGNAELGYGDGDEATVLNNSAYTVYFRLSYSADSTVVAFEKIIMEAVRDDGMVVYLNGSEVWRNNMPNGTPSYNTFASSIADPEDEWIHKTIDNNLVPGTNVFAVEVHQASSSSSDISFDFRLFSVIVSANDLFTADESWKYYDNGNEPSGEWKTSSYIDSSWFSGNAELGYGDGDEVTLINSNTLTAYFRKSFNATSAQAAFAFLSMNALRDDGMIVYLNGTEVWRDNMPNGAVNYGTFALTYPPEGIWINKDINNVLVEGTNVIAVEIHQNTSTSSDISFNFSLNVISKIEVELMRGPYLQMGSSNSITLKYRTSSNTETVISYGTSLSALNDTVTDNTLKSNHEIELAGLSPDTKYYYEIANNAETLVLASSDMYFKTAPPVGTDQFVRAWILGDAGTGNQSQKNVRDQYYNYVANASTNPDQTDMMLFLGDNAYNDGLDMQYQRAFFDIYKDQLKKSVAWSTLGNHDGHSANSNSQTGPYYDIFSFPTAAEAGGIASGTEAYYSFDYANIHFIILESYTLDNNANQMVWCTQDIQSTNQDWIIALFHHPAYSKGSHNSDSESQLINMRNNFLPILEANGVDLVLSGHSHSYERSYFINGHYGISNSFSANTHTVGSNGDLSGKADTSDGAYQKADTENPGTVYITTGSAGKISGGPLNHNAMYASLNQLGSCVLEIENDGGTGQNLNVKFLRDNGAVTDYFTINKTGLILSSLNSQQDRNAIKAYPVPVRSILNIEVGVNESLKKINIYNATGQLVKTTIRNQINVNTIKSGMYVVQIITDKGEHFQSIIIE